MKVIPWYGIILEEKKCAFIINLEAKKYYPCVESTTSKIALDARCLFPCTNNGSYATYTIINPESKVSMNLNCRYTPSVKHLRKKTADKCFIVENFDAIRNVKSLTSSKNVQLKDLDSFEIIISISLILIKSRLISFKARAVNYGLTTVSNYKTI